MSYPLAIVTWEDSIGWDGWTDLEEIIASELSQHVAVGWLVHETDDAITITQSYDTVNDNFGAIQMIAKSAIVELKFPFTSQLLIPTPPLTH